MAIIVQLDIYIYNYVIESISYYNAAANDYANA